MIYESIVKIKSMDQRYFAKTIIIIMGFQLHQSIIPKTFMVDTRYLLYP